MNDRPYSDEDERNLAEREYRADRLERQCEYADGADDLKRKGKFVPFDPVEFMAWALVKCGRRRC